MSIELIHGDCLQIMPYFPDEYFDMVFTSPPYADRRKSTYGGIKADLYVDWFLPFAAEFYRVLKPTGSFFLNTKPHTDNGERHLYVFDLVIALKRIIGFKYIDELSWIKNAFPGGYKGRFKNAFEPVYHFTKNLPSEITFNPLACGTPVKPESTARAFRKQCGQPKNGSGMTGMDTTNIRHLKMARPSNVIHVNNVNNQFTKSKDHPAVFPLGLPEFFIKSYTNVYDMVLDPFSGSGTTGKACVKLNRNFIGIDKELNFIKLSKERCGVKT